MNKVFSVIWNQSKGCWIVASEFAKQQGFKSLATKVAVIALMAGSIMSVEAAPVNVINLGTNNATGDYISDSTIIGTDNGADRINQGNPILENISIYGTGNSVEFDSNQAINNTTVMSYKNRVTKFNDIAIGTVNTLSGNTSVALGHKNIGATDSHNSVLIGAHNTSDNLRGIGIGTYNNAKADISMAVGSENTANGIQSIAIGSNNTANEQQSMTMGIKNVADGVQSIAMGNNNTTNEANSIAIGTNNTTNGAYSSVLGHNNKLANGTGYGVAVGYGLSVDGPSNVAIGAESTTFGQSAIAVGYQSKASTFGVAIGGYETTATGSHSIAMGYSADAIANDTVAIGTNAEAKADNGIALGNNTKVSVRNGVALGAASVANRTSMTGASTSDSSSVASRTVYAPSTVNSNDATAIRNTLVGDLGAVSVGSSAGTRQITNVAAGSADSDAVNVAQLKAVANTVKEVAGTIKDVEVTAGDNVTVASDTNGNKITYTISADVGKQDINNLQNQINTNKDTITNHEGRIIDLENKTFTDTDTIITVKAADNSITVTDDGNHNYTVAVSDDIKNQINNNTTNINNMGQRIDNLDSRVNKVGANAAALAGLHPLDFDPDDKWNFAAGYGNYKNANAMAVGAFYRPNEDTMFSVAGSMGNGENMISAGVSLKLGQKNGVSTTRVALAKEVEDLKAIVKAQNAEINTLKDMMRSSIGLNVKRDIYFPDVPENHWAYGYVKGLADKGIVEGYPDGMFKGDRTMTRYEFAAIVYRALENGAAYDEGMKKMAVEFDPELRELSLDRIRIDRIAGEDNDRHKIERVRINNKNNKANNDYRDVYGSHI